MASKRPRIVQLPLNSDPATAKALKALSKRTRKSQQAYLREAVQDLLAKYRNQATQI
jgi:predicted DNA-binding protein